MLMIRHFEERCSRFSRPESWNGTTHNCIGQEEIPVAVIALLRGTDDFVFRNHRGHGHYSPALALTPGCWPK